MVHGILVDAPSPGVREDISNLLPALSAAAEASEAIRRREYEEATVEGADLLRRLRGGQEIPAGEYYTASTRLAVLFASVG